MTFADARAYIYSWQKFQGQHGDAVKLYIHPDDFATLTRGRIPPSVRYRIKVTQTTEPGVCRIEPTTDTLPAFGWVPSRRPPRLPH